MATTELALSLPFLTLLFLGALDACHIIFIKDSLKLAAYEGCRCAAENEITTGEVRKRCKQLLLGFGIDNASVKTSPREIAIAKSGDTIQVKVTASAANYNYYLADVFGDTVLEGRATLRRTTGDIASARDSVR